MANFDSQAILNLFAALKTQATQSGLFERVIGHEPKAAPGTGFSYCLWLGAISPVPRVSGLSATAGRVVINARILTPFLQKSEDQIETNLMRRVLQMIGFYSAGFTVGGTVYGIDLLGAYGLPLEAGNIGYLNMDNSYYRAAELTIPIVFDNLWTQAD